MSGSSPEGDVRDVKFNPDREQGPTLVQHVEHSVTTDRIALTVRIRLSAVKVSIRE